MKLTTKWCRSRICFFTDRITVGRSAVITLMIICMMFTSLAGLSIANNPEPVNPAASTAFHGKVLKTIIVADYYPYSFVNEKGLPDGFSVDIAKAVAQVMDLKLEIGVDTWEYAKKALENGSIDFLPMMAYSSERLKSFDFSVPHTIAYDTVFVRKGTPEVVKLEDLSGKTVIIMNRDAAHDYLLSSGMSDKMKLILVDDLPEMFRLLAAGKGDAAIMPKLVGMIVLKKQTITNVEASSDIIDAYNRSFGFAVKKGNTTLLERLNQGLTIVKTTGQYEDLYKKWFGVLEPRGVPWRSVLKYAAGAAAVFLLIGMCLLLWSVSLKKQVALRTRSLEAEIMERERTENALRESEQRFRMAMEAAEEGLWDWDKISDYVYYSPGWGRILGYPPEEVEPSYEFWESRIHPEDISATLHVLNDHIDGRRPLFEAEHRILANNGEWIWVLGKGKVVARNAQGSILRLVGTMTDISERKRSEAALHQSEARRRLAQDAAKAGTWEWDLRTNENFWSEELWPLYGMEPHSCEPSYDAWRRTIHPDDRAMAERVVQEAASTGAELSAEWRTQDSTGAERWLMSRGRPVSDERGQTERYIGICIDITERKRAEQEKESLRTQLFQSQKMEALGTLVGGIAHDFNNMLQVILGYSDLLLSDKRKSEPGYDELRTIIETAKGGADLVTKLLAFGQQAPIFPVNMDLNHQISQLSTLMSRTLPQVVQVDLDLAEGPSTIHADHGQIDQLVMNLAINAAEAMPNGGRLKIATKTASLDDEYCRGHHGLRPGIYVMLSVSDTGRGMDKETLARIFDPFFSTKQRGSTKGTGLGLSVVQGIAQQHGGHVTCESEPGKGTEFKIYFPAIEESLAPTEAVTPIVQSGGSETILVVEDNLPVADLEQRFLTDAGYTVVVASNGREALEIYESRKEEISLVVLDLLMPEMSGRDCLMELVKIDPSVKVIVASGYAPEDALHREIRPLVKGFLHKPFAMAELVNQARYVLDGDPS